MPADMFFGATPAVFSNAKQLRKAMTPAESLLWSRLKSGKLGCRFRAQHPVNYFVADFYCHQARLIIEIDGSIHDSVDQAEYDLNRTYILEEFRLSVIRFRNEEVENDLEHVLSTISQLLPTSLNA